MSTEPQPKAVLPAVIAALFQKYDALLVNPADTIVWSSWAKEHWHQYDELAKLLEKPVRDSIKARALYVWLVPDLALCNFWPGEHVRLDYWTANLEKIGYSKLPRPLQVFVADLVIALKAHESTLKVRHSQYDEPRIPDCVDWFNGMIREMLEIESSNHELAERLFDAYNFDRTMTKSVVDPFGWFMCSKVGFGWKVRAEEKIRQLIQTEGVNSRYTKGYWEMITEYYNSEKANLSIEQVAKMVQFALRYCSIQHVNFTAFDGIAYRLAEANCQTDLMYQIGQKYLVGNPGDKYLRWEDATLAKYVIENPPPANYPGLLEAARRYIAKRTELQAEFFNSVKTSVQKDDDLVEMMK